jgi:hypothetical protein
MNVSIKCCPTGAVINKAGSVVHERKHHIMFRIVGSNLKQSLIYFWENIHINWDSWRLLHPRTSIALSLIGCRLQSISLFKGVLCNIFLLLHNYKFGYRIIVDFIYGRIFQSGLQCLEWLHFHLILLHFICPSTWWLVRHSAFSADASVSTFGLDASK